jgi:hypothetical protein
MRNVGGEKEMNQKFKVAKPISYERAIDQIAAEINTLWEKIEALESRQQPIQSEYDAWCICDSSYTGTHRNGCPLMGQRVRLRQYE